VDLPLNAWEVYSDQLAVTGPGEAWPPEPPVLLAGPAEMLAELLLPALAPLLKDGVRLRVTTGLADDLLAGLRAGTFDLVVSAVRPRGRTLRAEPLNDEEFVLVASPELAARLGPDALTPTALSAAPLLAYAEDLPILRRYWRHVFGTRLVAAPSLVVPDLRALKAAALAGAGVTVLPRYLCTTELAAGSLRLLLDPSDPPINTTFLVHRAGAHLSPHTRLVRDHLLTARY
ncbi:substrate-binding domain-containing protein, partial [Actinocorallia lasiicapitis]